jgi:hypothetical protein
LKTLDGFWTGSATKLTYVNNGYVEDGIGDATFADPDKTTFRPRSAASVAQCVA